MHLCVCVEVRYNFQHISLIPVSTSQVCSAVQPHKEWGSKKEKKWMGKSNVGIPQDYSFFPSHSILFSEQKEDWLPSN